MELEFGKHFKDATNLLLMMDHDSGYVEGAETCTSSGNECESLKEVGVRTYMEPDDFLLSEDALLEKPDISFNFDQNLPYEIDTKDYEETRRLFFSPEVISGSVKSNSTTVFSGLENDSSSEASVEILPEPSIVTKNKDTSIEEEDGSTDYDILMISASECDMSLEQTFDPIIIEKGDLIPNNNGNLISPLSVDSKNEIKLEGSAIILRTKCTNNSFQELSTYKEQLDNVNDLVPNSLPKNILNLQNIEAKNEEKHDEASAVMCDFVPNLSNLNIKNEYEDKKDEYPTKERSDENPRLPNEESIELVSSKTPVKIECESSDATIKCTSTDNWAGTSIHKSETPSKSNPLSTVTNTFEVPKEKRRLTLVFSKSEKENGYSVKRKYPSMTPEKKIANMVNPNISPDIFDDEMMDIKPSYFEVQTRDTLLTSLTQTQAEEKQVDKLDQKLLKRIQKGMSGVLPPPSVTVIHMPVHEILSKLEENRNLFFWNNQYLDEKDNGVEKQDASLNSSTESNNFSKSLLLNVDLEEARNSKWPEVFNMRCHGLHYNCGNVSEEIVDLCDKYQKRFVGAEIQSTCTVFETQNMSSPVKRKTTKPRWGGKSPGRRLSHLARRRITFSSANLQAGGSSLAGSRARQMLVDSKKIDLLSRRKSPRKTPKKTPSKSPKIKTRTPSSSAKKKLAMRFRKLTGEFEKSVPSTSEISSVHRALFKSPDRVAKCENSKGFSKSTKRALFQSPNRDTTSSLFANKSQDLSASEERIQLRRALFTSPRKNSPLKAKKSPFKHALKFGFEKKRKHSESDDAPPSKFPRSMSMDVKPSSSNLNKSLSRAQSELNISFNRSQSQNELSEQHKKKLRWAVNGALQSQNVTNTHPQWKLFASVLARVTRRFFSSQMAAGGVKPEGGTSERMHRIARYHVISVIKGKTADEIINEHLKSRAKVQRPQGYVAPDEFINSKIKAPSGGKENVFQDRANTIESWEKKKLEQISKPATTDIKIERIRKVINFGDDR